MFDHFEEVVRHEEFLTLNINDLCSIIKDDNLKVKCETIVYTVSTSTARWACGVTVSPIYWAQATMQWMRHDPANRKDVMMQILPCIRLPLIAPAFLQGAMDCDEFATVDMKRCRDYLSTVHEDLTTHRYRCLPRRRAPIKPLVLCTWRPLERQTTMNLSSSRLCRWLSQSIDQYDGVLLFDYASVETMCWFKIPSKWSGRRFSAYASVRHWWTS